MLSSEEELINTLGLGKNNIPIGTVQLNRFADFLAVTFNTDSPFVMDEVQVYVSNVPPTDSNPGSFLNKYSVSDPSDYFSTHTFLVNISAFIGDTLYIAAHAHVYTTV